MIPAFIPQDAEGNLLRIANIDNITDPWRSALEPIIKTYHAYLGDQVRGIYIHGSLARGNAKLHKSDIDTFCLTHDSPDILKLEWMTDAQRSLERQFPFASKVDLTIGSLKEIENSLHYRMILKILAVCIDGEDITDSLPNIKPDADLARYLTRSFPRRLERTRLLLDYVTHEEEVRYHCRWIMKHIVRAGFRLVMPREQHYTLHLETAAHTFIKYYPKKKSAMLHAFRLAHNPTADKAETLAIVDGLGEWLAKEIKKELS